MNNFLNPPFFAFVSVSVILILYIYLKNKQNRLVDINVVLVSPQIPQNTGNIARLTAANNLRLHLIEPLAFEITDKNVKRAGLDYWPEVDLSIHPDWQSFLEEEKPKISEMWFFSTHAKKSIFKTRFASKCYLVFGSETSGLAESFHKNYSAQMINLPMENQKVRSLNLANSAAIACYEAKRQLLY